MAGKAETITNSAQLGLGLGLSLAKYNSVWRSGGKVKKNMISIAPLGYELGLGQSLAINKFRSLSRGKLRKP